MLLKYLLICTTLFQRIDAERNFRVLVTKVECIDSGYYKSVNCTLDNRDNVSYVSLSMELPKPVTTLKIRAVLEASMPKRPKLKLCDIKLDACDFFRMSQKQEIMQIAKKYIGNFVNREFMCPLEANFTYIVKDVYVDVEDLASFTPELDFRLKFFVFEMNKIVFKFLLQGRIVHNQNINDMKTVPRRISTLLNKN